jgi:hypothetical protein
VIGDDPEVADLRLLLGNRVVFLGNIDRDADADAAARELLALAERAGTARISAARLSVATFLFDTGRWDDALAELGACSSPAPTPWTTRSWAAAGWRR